MTSRLTRITEQRSAAELQAMSRDSFRWLTTKMNQLRNPGSIPKEIKREVHRETNKYKLGYNTEFLIGGLYFFYYDPKFKATLPYYDTFPLVMPLERHADGFLGLNLHYLPARWRAVFMSKLMDRAIYNDENELKRIRITYDILNTTRRYREFRPCVKKYLHGHIRSKILAVQPDEWDVAIMLPVAQFKKEQPNEVWQDSINEIRNS